MTKEISKEVLDVCNLSTGVFNRGMRKGMQKGMQEGMQKGMQEGMQKGMLKGRQEGEMKKAEETAHELQKMGLTVENIARAVKVSVDVVRNWLSEPQVAPAK